MVPTQRRPPTLAYDLVDGVVVTAHGKTNPTDEEWARYVGDVGEWKPQLRGVLVYTLGGAAVAPPL